MFRLLFYLLKLFNFNEVFEFDWKNCLPPLSCFLMGFCSPLGTHFVIVGPVLLISSSFSMLYFILGFLMARQIWLKHLHQHWRGIIVELNCRLIHAPLSCCRLSFIKSFILCGLCFPCLDNYSVLLYKI